MVKRVIKLQSTFLLWISLFLTTAVSCSWISRKDITQQYYRERGELIVLTRNAPSTYYEDNTGKSAGFEHDLVQEFARDMNVKARFVVLDSTDEILEEMRAGNAHIAAAGLSQTKDRLKEFRFSQPYMQVSEEVICHKDLKVRRPSQLVGKKIQVVSDTSYVEKLIELKKDHDIHWLETEASTEQILQQVWEKKVDCTLADSVIFDLNHRHFPELRVAFTIDKKVNLGWMMAKSQKKLNRDLKKWFAEIKKDGRLQTIKDRYFGFIPQFDYYDQTVFKRRVEKVLPKFEKLFRLAGEEVHLDWRLLAAMGYQESHWDPNAKSPTGVRGIMMLTQVTAEEMGVKNRLDIEESIFGGSRYIRKILDRIPSFIPEPDRTWLALAAYNVGWAHLADARKLAIDLGKNPNRWEDVRTVLPLLSRSKYYKKLQHGYARGYEPVIYVNRIQSYLDILKSELR